MSDTTKQSKWLKLAQVLSLGLGGAFELLNALVNVLPTGVVVSVGSVLAALARFLRDVADDGKINNSVEPKA